MSARTPALLLKLGQSTGGFANLSPDQVDALNAQGVRDPITLEEFASPFEIRMRLPDGTILTTHTPNARALWRAIKAEYETKGRWNFPEQQSPVWYEDWYELRNQYDPTYQPPADVATLSRFVDDAPPSAATVVDYTGPNSLHRLVQRALSHGSRSNPSPNYNRVDEWAHWCGIAGVDQDTPRPLRDLSPEQASVLAAATNRMAHLANQYLLALAAPTPNGEAIHLARTTFLSDRATAEPAAYLFSDSSLQLSRVDPTAYDRAQSGLQDMMAAFTMTRLQPHQRNDDVELHILMYMRGLRRGDISPPGTLSELWRWIADGAGMEPSYPLVAEFREALRGYIEEHRQPPPD